MKRLQILKHLVLIPLFLFCFSCETNEESLEKTIIIASAKADCIGLIQQECLLIKENESQNWEYFYDVINGFIYEEGFEYVLLISEKQINNPPQDASSIETNLIKVVSKVEKTSENLPI